MKKAAIVGINDIRHITMIKIYTEFFYNEKIQFDIICSERYGNTNIKYNGSEVRCFKMADNRASKLKKLFQYFRFRHFVRSVFEKEHYDFTVIWGEHTAVLLYGLIKNHSPYCVNIRDVFFPKIPFYWNRLCKAVRYSCFSTWCAPTGQDLLPKHDYVIVMNQNKELVHDAIISKRLLSKGDVIHIGTVGYIRHLEPSKKLMKVLRNDSRYILQFFGTGAEELKKYADDIGMENIEIHEAFCYEQTSYFLNRIDVINSYCGDGKKDFTIAYGTPIRYGYSTYLYKPAIVSPNTYLSEKTGELGIAYTVNNVTVFPDCFYEWYYSINFETFKDNCDKFNKTFDDSLDSFNKTCESKMLPYLKE